MSTMIAIQVDELFRQPAVSEWWKIAPARDSAMMEKTRTTIRMTAGTMGWFITVVWNRMSFRLRLAGLKSQKPFIRSPSLSSSIGSHLVSRSGMLSRIQSSSTICPARDETGRPCWCSPKWDVAWANCFHLRALSLMGVPRVTGAPSRAWSNLRPGTLDLGVGM